MDNKDLKQIDLKVQNYMQLRNIYSLMLMAVTGATVGLMISIELNFIKIGCIFIGILLICIFILVIKDLNFKIIKLIERM